MFFSESTFSHVVNEPLNDGDAAHPMCPHWGLARGTLRRPRTPCVLHSPSAIIVSRAYGTVVWVGRSTPPGRAVAPFPAGTIAPGATRAMGVTQEHLLRR